MTAPAAQWQLDRLSTSARDAAETASLGAGVSLSAWLTKVIGNACAAEGVTLPPEPPRIIELMREIRGRIAAPPPSPPPIPEPSLALISHDRPQVQAAPVTAQRSAAPPASHPALAEATML